MHCIKTVDIFALKIALGRDDLFTVKSSQTRVILKTEKFTVSKWCIPDKFCLQKLGEQNIFSKVKVLSFFLFQPILEKLIVAPPGLQTSKSI